MAASRKREIRDQDVQGLRCLRKIRPLDPAPLKEIAAELGHTIRSRSDRRLAAVGQQITVVAHLRGG